MAKIVDSLPAPSSSFKIMDELLRSGNVFLSQTVKEWLTEGFSVENYLSLPLADVDQIRQKIPARFLDGRFGFLYKVNQFLTFKVQFIKI